MNIDDAPVIQSALAYHHFGPVTVGEYATDIRVLIPTPPADITDTDLAAYDDLVAQAIAKVADLGGIVEPFGPSYTLDSPVMTVESYLRSN